MAKSYRKLKIIFALIISVAISIIITYLVVYLYNPALKFVFLIFGFVFICIFTPIEFIVNKNKESMQFNIQTIIGLLTVFVLLGQLGIFQIQAAILDRQTKILERSNPPYEPYIQIIPDYDDLVIPAFELVDKRNFENDWTNDIRWAKVDMTIYNFGKMDSQHIHCFRDVTNKTIFSYITPDSNIQNVPAGTSSRLRLHIRSIDCQEQELEYCNPELIPTGKQKIILMCECYGCKEQRYFNQTVEFCIYYKNMTDECSEFVTSTSI